MSELTSLSLAVIMPRASTLWVDPLNYAAQRFALDPKLRFAAWLAQLAAESGELTELEENLHYSGIRLMQVYPREFPDLGIAEAYAAKGPEAIANRVYSGLGGNGNEQTGDGYLFRGRGPLQLTFRNNYRDCSAGLQDASILSDPDRLLNQTPGALSAAWFFREHGCVPFADAGNIDSISRRINGPAEEGRLVREKYYQRALKALT